MGLKTIQAKHAEAKKELETTIGSFLKDAREIKGLPVTPLGFAALTIINLRGFGL